MVIVPKSGGRNRARRSKRRERSRAQRRPPQAQSASGDIETDANEDDRGVKLWASTRHGATAGRGFHYQDAVLAWLATRMLTGELQLDRLVPEGIEDISCEGPHGTQVQVKSRQERVGDYRASEVAQFLLELHRKHGDGPTSRDRLHLVLERPFDGHEPANWQTRLTDDPDGALIVAVRRLAAQRQIDLTDDFLHRTTVVVLPWRTAANHTREAIEAVEGVPPAVAEQLVLALRSMMAAIQDQNVNPDFSHRRSADGALIRRTVLEAMSVIDVESLSVALRTGVCEVLDLDTQISSDVFYEGVEAQPGHIAAGLPAPRVKETTAASEALDSNRPVLITGPSGVGKSTIVWATTYTMRHALWYRVRRLAGTEDVEALARLASSCNASAAAPVGFVVDGVGIEGISAWDSLVDRFQGRPFVYLIGSCRSEDLYTVQRLALCAQVEVALDELTAQEIYDHLSEAERTTEAHWLEAFRVAGGLTMEYTFLLTQGRRLSEVIHDQIARRVRENRWLELQIIALVSTAHRWRAALPLSGLTDSLGVDQGQVRQALSRLLMEHLVVEVNGQLLGVHELRSRELSKQVHQVPPPVLTETVRSILMTVESSSLFRIIFHSLIDESELEEAVLSALTSRIEGAPEDQCRLVRRPLAV
jgi:DNA-binding transcriptional ArsR family regulator